MIEFWSDLSLFWKIVLVIYLLAFPLMMWRRTALLAGVIGGVAFGIICGYILGSLAGEAVARLVVTAGPNVSDVGNITFTSIAEYRHRLHVAGNVGGWLGGVIAVLIVGLKTKGFRR